MIMMMKQLCHFLEEHIDDQHSGEPDQSYEETNTTDPEWLEQEAQGDECSLACQHSGSCQLGCTIHGLAAELLENEDKLSFIQNILQCTWC
jgi:hypothetical protein